MSAALKLPPAQQHAEYPEGATPPQLEGWTWWNSLREAAPQRMPQRPSLIDSGVLVAFDTLAELAHALAGRLDGRRAVLVRSVATYFGYDTFPAFSVHAEAPRGDSGGPPAAGYLCCVAVQTVTAAALEAAIAEAQAARS